MQYTRLLSVFFFFSSRRRHTRFDCDWSSDVCSSDLGALVARQPRASAFSSLSSRAAASPWGVPRYRSANRASSTVSRSRRPVRRRSEEHTSELQSQSNLVCRLLLEKKKMHTTTTYVTSHSEPCLD